MKEVNYITRPKRIDLSIEIKANSIGSGFKYPAKTINGSLTGLLVQFEKSTPFIRGSSLVEIHLDDMSFICTVIRVEPDHKVALNIVQVEARFLIKWKNLINSHDDTTASDEVVAA